MAWSYDANGEKGSGSFRPHRRTTSRPHTSCALRQHFDLALEMLATPGFLLQGVRAKAVDIFAAGRFVEQLAIRVLARAFIAPQGEVRLVRNDARVVLAHRIVGMAGPAVALRRCDHAGPHRVEFDVAVAGQQVTRAVHQRRLESPFPEGARPAIAGIERPHVAPPDRLHHARRRAALGRGEQQVHVVGHQDVGMDRATMLQGRFPQFLAIAREIRAVRETGLAIVAALHHMLRDSRQVQSRKACHVASLR